jgi:hypothetical protein
MQLQLLQPTLHTKFLTQKLSKFCFSCKLFPFFDHQNPGSGSVFSLKCGSAIYESGSKTLQIREAKLMGVVV